jgi:hypothetical protein
MPRRLSTVAVVPLVGSCACINGCTNGRIGGISPPDESCVVYHLHGALRVTDLKGTRKLGSVDDYGYYQELFSRDGRWLLISGGDYQDGGWRRAGDRLTLYETRTAERFDSELPFNIVPGSIPWDTPAGTGIDYFRKTHDLAQEYRGNPAIMARSPVPVYIDEWSRVWFGPIDDCFDVWSPRAAGRTWDDWPADQASPPPDGKFDRGLMDTRQERFSSEFVIVIPFDGWNARRTVWVRPDGEVVELGRQNDGPLLPGQLFVGFLGSMSPSNFGGPLQAALYWPYTAATAPGAVAKQAEREKSELAVAHEKLKSAIEKRRSAAASQTVTITEGRVSY